MARRGIRLYSFMILCSCNIITRRQIEAMIERLLADDPYAVLTPNLIYHRLGRRGRCCGCFPQVTRILVEHGELIRAKIERGEFPDRFAAHREEDFDDRAEAV